MNSMPLVGLGLDFEGIGADITSYRRDMRPLA